MHNSMMSTFDASIGSYLYRETVVIQVKANKFKKKHAVT